MNKNIIDKYVAMSLAIKVFKLDLKKFKEFKMANLYQDLLESTIEKLKNDYNNLKIDLYTTHHLDIKPIGNNNGLEQFKVNDKIISYSPQELKKLTEEVMNEYLNGNKASAFERRERI